MNYLALDTCGKNLTIIICKDDVVEVFDDAMCGVRHSERLMSEIENLVGKTKFDLNQADFFACVVGAGSFTGIRIGVSTVKALCFAYDKPALSITSFDTIAYNEKNGRVLSVIDAGHNGYYVAGYNDLTLEYSPSYIYGEELEKLSKKYTLLSDGEIEGFNVKTENKVTGYIKAIEYKQHLANGNLDELSPIYVRKSQAEENR